MQLCPPNAALRQVQDFNRRFRQPCRSTEIVSASEPTLTFTGKCHIGEEEEEEKEGRGRRGRRARGR